MKEKSRQTRDNNE